MWRNRKGEDEGSRAIVIHDLNRRMRMRIRILPDILLMVFQAAGMTSEVSGVRSACACLPMLGPVGVCAKKKGKGSLGAAKLLKPVNQIGRQSKVSPSWQRSRYIHSVDLSQGPSASYELAVYKRRETSR